MEGQWFILLSVMLSGLAVMVSGRYASRRMPTALSLFSLVVVVFLSAFYIVADYFTGNGIEESVLYHLQTDMTGAGVKEYYWVIFFVFLALTSVMAFAVMLFFKITFFKGRHGFLAVGLVVLLSFGAIFFNPATQNIYSLWSRVEQGRQSDAVFPESYRRPINKAPEKPLNFVVLYLESLERTYLNEKEFPGLAPNLSHWEKEATHFTNIRQVTGTGWTIGGMVASQCGIPLMTPGHGNAMSGMPDFLPLADCLGGHFERQGYQLDFMGGADLSFAGKGKFYHTHGFDKVDGGTALAALLDNPPTSAWGIYDDALLSLFEQRLAERSAKNQPFGLLGLTLDTHHPEGHMPPACDGIEYADGSNPILNAVHCSDQLVGDFIDGFMQSPAADDTVLVVMSDHLAMRNSAWERLENHQRRNLLMMFSPDLAPNSIDKPGSTLDVAPTLLSAMGYNISGWGFGRNMLSGVTTLVEREESVNAYLNRQRGALSTLWRYPQLDKGLDVNAENNTATIQGDSYSVPALMRLDDDAGVTHFIPSRKNRNDLPVYMGELSPEENFIWIDQCLNINAVFSPEVSNSESEDSLCLAAGNMQSEVAFQEVIDGEINFTLDEIENQLNAPPVMLEKQQRRQQQLARFNATGSWYTRDVGWDAWESEDKLIIRSASFGAGRSSIIQGSRRLSGDAEFKRGVSLIGISPDKQPKLIKHVDTCLEATPDIGFEHEIEAHGKIYSGFAVVVEDTAFCQNRRALSVTLKDTELVEWSGLEFRQPYIGLITMDGNIHEVMGNPGGTAALILHRSENIAH